MSDPWTPLSPGSPERPASPPAPYGDPTQPYGAAGPTYGQGAPTDGPLGSVRPTGRCILLTVVTLGIYVYVYNYKVHGEMQRHSGRGVGAGVALLLTFLAGVAMPFVTSAEVGSLYGRRGWPEPVRGWTGLWLVLPVAVGYLLLILAVVAVGASASPGQEPSDGAFVAFGLLTLLFLVTAVAGAVVWFVKTNGALNRYWQAVGEGRSPH